MQAPSRLAIKPHTVDNADWLKTAAIILVSVDHFGHFFMEDDHWWSVFGRPAAPTFFFLIGYAQSRTVPFRWIWLGVILTLLESWNEDWTWVALNILMSFALIRMARPYVQDRVRHHGWAAFALLVSALIALQPIAEKMVDYGAEGWLWALFGLYQRIYADERAAVGVDGSAHIVAPPAQGMKENIAILRLLACLVAAVFYVWQEQKEFSFPPIQFTAVILSMVVLSASLFLFRRGPSRIQPREPVARTLCFIGRHTLEFYAVQLAGSELLVRFVPDLSS